MIRQILLKPVLGPVLRFLYLRTPGPMAAAMHWLFRSASDPRREHFERAFQTVTECSLEGDYLEFGVYRGSSMILSSRLAKRYGCGGMRFFAFDSFEGLPDSEGTEFVRGEYQCSRELFTRLIQKGGVAMDKVVVVEGLYADSLTPMVKDGHRLDRAAIVHVDCDLYTSTKEVLKFVEDLVHQGSVIIFDDWHAFDDGAGDGEPASGGEKKAFLEWSLSECFDELCDSEAGKAFVMRRPAERDRVV